MKKIFIIGPKSRLGLAIISTHSNSKNYFTTTIKARDFSDDSQNKFTGDMEYENIFFWCSDKSRITSTAEDVESDLIKLKTFLNSKSLLGRNRRKIVYFSSGGSVYGDNPGIVTENSKLNPGSWYAEMKVKAETILEKHGQENNIPIIIFRLANVFGIPVRGSNQGIIEKFISAIENDAPVNLFVTTDSMKQYGTYLDYAKYIEHYLNDSSEFFEIRNVAPTNIYTIQTLKTISEKFFGKTLKLTNSSEMYENTVILGNEILNSSNDLGWETYTEFLKTSFVNP